MHQGSFFGIIQAMINTKRKLTIGILAHVDTGKTTLSEAMLYKTGMIKSFGRVDDGDAFLDNDIVERERGITIYSKNARLSLGDLELILIDTPGHVDFSTEMERSLAVLDAAILLVSGSSGVQSHTLTLWSLLEGAHIPVFIFVNKMDMPGVDKEKIMTACQNKLSMHVVDFSDTTSEEFLEEVSSNEEALMEKYLEGEALTDADISKAIMDRKCFPVYFGSALKIQGIDEFLEGLGRFLDKRDIYDENGAFAARVYKITRDAEGKRLTFLKILGGTLKVKDILNEEKINEIRIYSGEGYTLVKEVSAGDVCAVVGLKNSKNMDTYGKVPAISALKLQPVISYAVHYPPENDTNVMLSYLKEAEEEDPSLNVEYREQTREITISLMGDVQTEVLKRKFLDKYGIPISFSEGRICYRETIDIPIEGVGHFEPLRHYAEVHLLLEPLELNSGMEFEADIPEDDLALNWQRLILTHMMEREHRGTMIGAPLTDVKIRLVSGRAHIKHTEGGDFRQAVYRAIRQGLMTLMVEGNTHILEPYYDYTLTVPDTYTGRAMTDLSNMSGTVTLQETDLEEHVAVLTGRAPVACINSYSKEVAAYSKGLGKLMFSPAGYGPCHNEEEVLSNSRYNPDADLRNPSSSVFCSHGAGTVIPWDEVPDYMHLEYSYNISEDKSLLRADNESAEAIERANKRRMQYSSSSDNDIAIGYEEVDEIIRQSSHANEKGRNTSYKGISKAMRERNRINKPRDNSEPVYKGSPQKEKYILVDGYNVIHAWPQLDEIAANTLDGAAAALNDILCNYQAIVDVNVMVVYDAYKVKNHRVEENAYNNITVVYTREAQTADQYIEHYAHENSKKYDITVITSDGLEQVIVTGNGALVMSSREFKEVTDSVFKSFNEKYGVT